MNDINTSTEVIALLRQVRDEQARQATQLSAIGAAVMAKKKLRPSDEAKLKVLLAAIVAAVNQDQFTVKELYKHAALPKPETAARLRAALNDIGDSRAVGRILRKGNGIKIDGFMLDYIIPEAAGKLYQVLVIHNGHN